LGGKRGGRWREESNGAKRGFTKDLFFLTRADEKGGVEPGGEKEGKRGGRDFFGKDK